MTTRTAILIGIIIGVVTACGGPAYAADPNETRNWAATAYGSDDMLGLRVGMRPWAVCADADGLSVSLLTDASTSRLEARVGLYETDVWEAGLTATWYAEDSDPDWGLGGYTKLIVDPNGSVPVANWLPKVGAWLNLPETLPVETYLLGKIDTIPLDDGPDAITASAGAGMQVGPAVLEWVYRVVEGGDSTNPVLSSGAELWFGGRIEF